jgi:FAD/FMN-containing dehydrogenase
MKQSQKTLHSWGGRTWRGPLLTPAKATEVPDWSAARTFLAVGKERSYGDVAQNSGGAMYAARALKGILSFDATSGLVTVEAGITLGEVILFLVPKGFFLPVVPGTKDITVGGAIGNDIHGKNHHIEGSFGHHVTALRLLRSDCGVVECSPSQNPELFAATVGGMGLTGIILSATMRATPIASNLLDVHHERFSHLDDFDRLCGSADAAYTHTVAWIDTLAPAGQLGRGIFMSGRWSKTPGPLKAHSTLAITIPPMPVSPLLPPLLKVFNSVYFHKSPRQPKTALAHYNGFFFPLDALNEWTRLYGPAGMTQFQAVVPKNQFEAVRAILNVAQKAGQGSFLSVLKKFGSMPNVGMMSFPMDGYTVALDFANRKATPKMLQTMAQIVEDAGGRFYSAKDAGYQTPEAFAKGYPMLETFRKYVDPKISSDQWRRLNVQ